MTDAALSPTGKGDCKPTGEPYATQFPLLAKSGKKSSAIKAFVLRRQLAGGGGA